MADDTPNPLQRLEEIRDRIRVQIHLASMDAKDEFERLEKTFQDAKQRVERATEGATDAVEDTVQKVVEDLREGYDRIASQLGLDR